MATQYPSQIDREDNLPTQVDLISPVRARAINELRDAIIAIQTELGIEPSGSFADVRERIDFIDQLLSGGGGLGTTASDIIIADSGSNYLSTDTEGALAEIGAVLLSIPPPTAANVSIVDSDGYYVSTNVEGALAELGASGSTALASQIPIADIDGYYTSTNVEGALAELGKYKDFLLSVEVSLPADGYTSLVSRSPFGFNVLELTAIADSGTASGHLAIDEIAIPSSTISISTTETSKALTYYVNQNEGLDLALSNTLSLTNVRATIHCRR